MAYQTISFTAGQPLDAASLNQLMENTAIVKADRDALQAKVDLLKQRQFLRYSGTGSASGSIFNLPTQASSIGSGLIVADHIATPSLGNRFRALVDCWVDYTMVVGGSSTHGYCSVVQFVAVSNSSIEIANDFTHEGSTTGYTMGGQIFMGAGDYFYVRRDHWPTPPTSIYVYLAAHRHVT